MLTQVGARTLLVIGLMLLAGSWLVLLLTVIKVISSSIWLSLIAYAISVVGLVVGLFGTVQYVRHTRGE